MDRDYKNGLLTAKNRACKIEKSIRYQSLPKQKGLPM